MQNEYTEMRREIDALKMKINYQEDLIATYKKMELDMFTVFKNHELDMFAVFKNHDQKVTDIKDFFADKIDVFLKSKWQDLVDAQDQSSALLEAWRLAMPARYMVDLAISSEEVGLFVAK